MNVNFTGLAMPEEMPQQWPWDRLLVFALGCVLASVGTYTVIFQAFHDSFGVEGELFANAYAWGTLAIIVGILLLSAPWFKAGPLAKRWSQDNK